MRSRRREGDTEALANGVKAIDNYITWGVHGASSHEGAALCRRQVAKQSDMTFNWYAFSGLHKSIYLRRQKR
jgi:hypothetical protein